MGFERSMDIDEIRALVPTQENARNTLDDLRCAYYSHLDDEYPVDPVDQYEYRRKRLILESKVTTFERFMDEARSKGARKRPLLVRMMCCCMRDVIRMQ